MRACLLIFTCLIFYMVPVAQQNSSSIKTKIIDDSGKEIPNATVALLKATDSTLVKATISGNDGVSTFENVPQGEYLIKISAPGKADKFSTLIKYTGTSINVGTLKLSKKISDLKEVTVTAKKPFIQKLHDRIVVNVDNSVVNAGSNALEVLERSPGVTIDANDIISMRGRQGVIILIDGKQSPMSGTELVNYLKSLLANTIERIDLITNPSSKYDAAGNSGIIDIRMKKDQKIGTNGTLSANYGQGVYPRLNTGISLNHRNKKMNLFGSYNYGYRKNLNHLYLDRNFYTDKIFNGSDLKDNHSIAPFESNTIRAGADFFPSKKTIIGFVVNSNLNSFSRNSDNNTIVINELRDPVFTFNTNARNKDNYKNYLINLNFKHSFNAKGEELTADFDYGKYDSKSKSTTLTSYFELNGEEKQPDYILLGNQTGDLSFVTAKTDYTLPLNKSSSIEAGLKTSFVSSDNDAKFLDASNGIALNDPTKTNHFLYDENNNAAYLNYKKDFKKFDIQLGLRAEQTNIKTHQAMGNINWDSSYLQIFPAAFFNYRINTDNVLGISVSRRIDRPGYSQLNPFLFLIDVSTYSTGNPGLLPQFTWAYELTYTLKRINFALGYSHSTNNQNIAIARFKDVFPNIPQDENVTVQIPVNIQSSDYAGLSISAPAKITNWWNMISNADIYYNHFNGILGDTKLNRGKPAGDIRTVNNFTFKNGWSAELHGNYSTGGQYGFMISEPQWGVGAGIQKVFMQEKATLKLNVTDIFWTNLPKAEITYNNYIERWNAIRDTRVVNLNLTYRFGKNTVQGARRRTTGSEEERKRAGN